MRCVQIPRQVKRKSILTFPGGPCVPVGHLTNVGEQSPSGYRTEFSGPLRPGWHPGTLGLHPLKWTPRCSGAAGTPLPGTEHPGWQPHKYCLTLHPQEGTVGKGVVLDKGRPRELVLLRKFRPPTSSCWRTWGMGKRKKTRKGEVPSAATSHFPQ